MKKLPLSIAAFILLASVNASAITDSEIIETPVAPTKAAAYDLGVNKLSTLTNSSPRQLEGALDTPFGDIEMDTLHVRDGGYVTVEERVDANGKVGYIGQVNIDVEYEMHDSDQ